MNYFPCVPRPETPVAYARDYNHDSQQEDDIEDAYSQRAVEESENNSNRSKGQQTTNDDGSRQPHEKDIIKPAF